MQLHVFTKPYKILPFSKRQKATKTALAVCSMLITFFSRCCVLHINIKCLQACSKNTVTPSRHRIHLKTDMSYAITLKYSQELSVSAGKTISAY